MQPIRPEESVQLARALEPARRLLASNKPSIALVQGAAVGRGLALALACDFRIASPDAKFAYAYGRIGLAGDLGATWLLSHLLGPHGAYRFAMRGLVLAHEAQTLGLIDAVADDLEVELGTLVDQILAVPSGAAAAIKSNLRSVQTMSFDEAGSLEAATFQRLRVSPDHVEAIDAFLERRSPRFTGK